MFDSGLGPMHFQFSLFANRSFEYFQHNRLWLRKNRLTESYFHEQMNKLQSWWFEWNWKWTDPRPQLLCALVANTFILFFFCSWCLFISQRLCVNMSIQIKHIVCIYCLFTCIACKNNHPPFHVYHQGFLNRSSRPLTCTYSWTTCLPFLPA